MAVKSEEKDNELILTLNNGDKEKFQKINEAYETLSDPDKRKIYDATGMSSNE